MLLRLLASAALVAAASGDLEADRALVSFRGGPSWTRFSDEINKELKESEDNAKDFFDKIKKDAKDAKDAWKKSAKDFRSKMKQGREDMKGKVEAWFTKAADHSKKFRAAKGWPARWLASSDLEAAKAEISKAEAAVAAKLAESGALMAAGVVQDKLSKLQEQLEAAKDDALARVQLEQEIAGARARLAELQAAAQNGEVALATSLQTIVGVLGDAMGEALQAKEDGSDRALGDMVDDLQDQLTVMYDVASKKSQELGKAMQMARSLLQTKQAELQARLATVVEQIKAETDEAAKKLLEDSKAVIDLEIAALNQRVEENKEKASEQVEAFKAKLKVIQASIQEELEAVKSKVALFSGNRGRGWGSKKSGDLDKVTKNLQEQLQDINKIIASADSESQALTQAQSKASECGQLKAQIRDFKAGVSTGSLDDLWTQLGACAGSLEEGRDSVGETRSAGQRALMKLAADVLSGVAKLEKALRHGKFRGAADAKEDLRAEMASHLQYGRVRVTQIWQAVFASGTQVQAALGPSADQIAEEIGRLTAQLAAAAEDAKADLEAQIKALEAQYTQLRASMSAEMSAAGEQLAEIGLDIAQEVGAKLNALGEGTKDNIQSLRGLLLESWRAQSATVEEAMGKVAEARKDLAKKLGELRQAARQAHKEKKEEAAKAFEDALKRHEDRLGRIRGGVRKLWKKTIEKVGLAESRIAAAIAKLEGKVESAQGALKEAMKGALEKLKEMRAKLDELLFKATASTKSFQAVVNELKVFMNELGLKADAAEGDLKTLLSDARDRVWWVIRHVTEKTKDEAEVDSAKCSAHPVCAAKGLAGDCCPTTDDVVLDCCQPPEPDRSQVSKLRSHLEIAQTRLKELAGGLAKDAAAVAGDVQTTLQSVGESVESYVTRLSAVSDDVEKLLKDVLKDVRDRCKEHAQKLGQAISKTDEEAEQTMSFRRRLAESDDAIAAAAEAMTEAFAAAEDLFQGAVQEAELQGLSSAAAAERMSRGAEPYLSSEVFEKLNLRKSEAFASVETEGFSEPELAPSPAPAPTAGNSGGGHTALVVVLVLLALAALAGGGYIFMNKKQQADAGGSAAVELGHVR